MSATPNVWMPLFIADYQSDTSRLTLAEHGAYLLLIMDYWRNGPPPDDDHVLARILGVERRDWCRIRARIAPYFNIKQGVWTHKRIEQELAGARERSGKAASKAKAAATRRWDMERQRREALAPDAPSIAPSIPSSMLGAMPEHMLEQCPPPVTYSETTSLPENGPSDPNKEAWDRVVRLLCAKGARKDPAARSLFGKLLADHQLEARDLLPAIVKAEGLGTQDPSSYLTKAAKAIRQRRPDAPPSVEDWGDDQWEIAIGVWRAEGQWGDSMGPKPGEPGCHVPRRLLVTSTTTAGAA